MACSRHKTPVRPEPNIEGRPRWRTHPAAVPDRNLQNIENCIRLSPFASSKPRNKFHLASQMSMNGSAPQAPIYRFKTQVHPPQTITNWDTLRVSQFPKDGKGTKDDERSPIGSRLQLEEDGGAVRVCGEALPFFLLLLMNRRQRHLKFSHEKSMMVRDVRHHHLVCMLQKV